MPELPVGEEEQRFRAAVAKSRESGAAPDFDAICAAEKIHPTRLAWLIARMECAEKKPSRKQQE